ncbi:MAG: secondary thiamine-phosphate synthase enzyme YjbQ [Gammaproteobacteria bacterium]|nr:secondary thiamine-phosphate synthase enzyme YjbQ [Gammaproteobacteria bacterium]
MNIDQHTITILTDGRGTQNITADIINALSKRSINHGLCHLFLQHTSASLILCENYDPQVRVDLENFLLRLVPDDNPMFEHIIEGQDDMPAHVRTILTQTSLSIPIQSGTLALGTWQGIYLYEHRYQPQTRTVCMTWLGH